MKKLDALFSSKIYIAIYGFIAMLCPMLFQSARATWYAIDGFSFKGFCILISVLIHLNAIFAVTSLYTRELLQQKFPSLMRVLYLVSLILTCLFAIAIIATYVIAAGLVNSIFAYFAGIAPYYIAVMLVVLTLFGFRRIPTKYRTAMSIVLLAVLSLFLLLIGFEASVFKATTPMVLVTGDDEYTVLWTTTHTATGALEYEKDGVSYTLYDTANGVIRSNDTIHKVTISKSQLSGASYRVVSQRIRNRLSYSADKGRTVNSDFVLFDDTPLASSTKLLAVSDIHDKFNTAKKAAAACGEYDAVLLLGDISNVMDTKEDLAKTITVGGDLSRGSIPVFYVRGNHETRSAYAEEVAEYMTGDSGEFYYTFSFGSIAGIVLDSGEDKADDHIEYAGLAAFEEYRAQQKAWLEKVVLDMDENTQYVIALSHDTDLGNYFGDSWAELLNTLGVGLTVGGHTHKIALKEENGAGDTMLYYTYTVGGINGKEYDYACSLLTFENGKVAIKAVDEKGTILFEQEVELS